MRHEGGLWENGPGSQEGMMWHGGLEKGIRERWRVGKGGEDRSGRSWDHCDFHFVRVARDGPVSLGEGKRVHRRGGWEDDGPNSRGVLHCWGGRENSM